MAKTNQSVELVIEFLEQAFNKSAWHGITLRGSLRNVEYKEALWRPSPKRHNIREIALHTAYWKYIVWRKVSGHTETSFPYPGSDWQKLPAKFDKKTWDKEKKMLTKYHTLLIKELNSFPASKLDKMGPKSKYKYKQLLLGIGSHDLYHGGQIQLIKRLKRRKKTK